MGRFGRSDQALRKFVGFTLLELLVVMVIIGLLAGYVGPKYFSQIGKSESKIAKAQIEAFDKALAQYRLDVGHYSTTNQSRRTRSPALSALGRTANAVF